jgi:hypothetical protein
MMEYAEEAKNLASETTREVLATDRKLELALTRLVEIIDHRRGSGKSFYPDPRAISGYSVDRNDRAQKPSDPWLRRCGSGYPLGYYSGRSPLLDPEIESPSGKRVASPYLRNLYRYLPIHD